MRQRLGIFVVFIASALVLAAGARADDHGGSNGTELKGLVTSRPPSGFVGDWTIGGRIVHVSSLTQIETEGGAPGIGSSAEVKGTSRADGSIDAAEIKFEAAAGVPPPQEAHLVGLVESLPGSGLVGDWKVGGRTVHVSSATKIETEDGVPAVGATVEVEGTLRMDGSIDAVSIEVRAPAPTAPSHVEFRGAIDALPPSGLVGDWTVSGKIVHVAADTRLQTDDGGVFAVGGFVQVEGTLRADGSVDALSIELKFSPGAGAPQVELNGAVESLSADPGFLGDWKVAGVTIHVTAATILHTENRTLAVGSFVEVKGTRRADGSIDAARIELLWSAPTSGATKTSVVFIPSVAHAPGRVGAFFTTSVTFSNAAAVPVQVEVRFHGHDQDGRAPRLFTFSLGAQETRTIDDVLGTLFGATSDFGALSIASNSAALMVSSRTGTPGAGGRFGQDVPAAGREDLVHEGLERRIAGLRQDAAVRTNLVVANAGEIDTDVEIELDDAEGSALGSARFTLRPFEMRQVNDVAAALGAPDGFRDGRLKLSTPTANGAFASFASEIDNGTNDPRTLWPR